MRVINEEQKSERIDRHQKKVCGSCRSGVKIVSCLKEVSETGKQQGLEKREATEKLRRENTNAVNRKI